MSRANAVPIFVLVFVLILGLLAGALLLAWGESDEMSAADAQYQAALSAPQPTLTADQYQGICAVVTPPDPDPCDAVNGVLRYGFLGAMVNVPYLYKWRVANPGEVTRLNALMAAPKCSVPSSPQPQTMRTQFGAALGSVVEAIACARHPEPITWPVPNPALSPTRTDKTPPSAPGPIIVTP